MDQRGVVGTQCLTTSQIFFAMVLGVVGAFALGAAIQSVLLDVSPVSAARRNWAWLTGTSTGQAVAALLPGSIVGWTALIKSLMLRPA